MTPEEQRLVANQFVALASALVGRRSLAGILGMQFGTKRDLYAILGYNLTPLYDDYLARYKRQDIAGRVVDLPAQDTWRLPPSVRDGAPGTAFNRAWEQLADARRVWHYLERTDRLAGVGRFGLLLIGVRDGKPLAEPLQASSLKGPEDVLYLSPFAEGSATISTWTREPQDPRFGLPETYTLQMGNEGAPGGSERAHWTRVLHVADDLLEDDVFGRPRLERIYNRLDDLEKIVGGGSEATWQTMDRGLHADVRDEYTLPPDQEESLNAEIEEYIHGLRRFIRTQGVNLNPLGGQVVDPTGLFSIITDLIAAESGIPKRILLGSERGELASTQDEANWARAIASRQTSYAEPTLLRPFIDRLVWAGALPAPQGGAYKVDWPSLFELTPTEKADVFGTLVGARANPEAAARLAGYSEEQVKELAHPAPQPEQQPEPDDEEGGPTANSLRTNEGEPSAEELEMQAALEAFFEEWQGPFAEAVSKKREPDWEAFAAALALALLPLLSQAATNRAIALGVETGVAFDTAEIAELAAQWAREYSFELVKGLTDTTRKLVSEAVEQYALNPAMTKADVAKLLEPAFGRVRAQMIAATETTRAFSKGVAEYQKLLQAAGVRTVRVWRTLPGACVLICLPLEGKKEGEWGMFSEGPPGHVGCRCDTFLEPAE